MKVVLWFFVALLGVGLVLALMGQKKVHTELLIPAPPKAIWAVLSDASNYKAWNPVIVQVEGTYEKGGTLTNHVNMPGETKPTLMKSKVLNLQKEREISQFFYFLFPSRADPYH